MNEPIKILTRFPQGHVGFHYDRSTVEPLDKLVEQLGIDIRQIGQQAQMREFIRLLQEEIRLTEQFLAEC